MSSIGLLLVGVVLLVNGLVILKVVPERSAALLNVFVGTLQVVFPTIVLVLHDGESAVLAGTWPTYLFGITYLYYGLGIYLRLEPQGLGWFSAFVAVIAGFNAVTSVAVDPVFAVIWATWAVMWSLFFALMALGLSSLERFAGWFLVLLGPATCTVPALFQLRNLWSTSTTAGLLTLFVVAALTAVAFALGRGRLRTTEPLSVPAVPANHPASA
ncbi:MAG TPA: AmiS/UreI family transporter [Actinomycetales bacterium]|nr:AmiS/UreI family transporter [Actinomycetales bacterium]